MKQLFNVIAACALLASAASVANSAPMLPTAWNGFVDNAPIGSLGPEDIDIHVLFPSSPAFGGEYAVSSAGYYSDAAVLLYDFGSPGAVASASLTLDIYQVWRSPTDGEGPVVDMYVYGDDNGQIQLDDLFRGTLWDSTHYWRAGLRTFDVTAAVNEALSTSRYVAFRFQSQLDASPGLNGIRLSFWNRPTLNVPAIEEFDEVTVPEPSSVLLFGTALVALLRRRRVGRKG